MTNNTTPQTFAATDDPRERLRVLRAALDQILCGQQRAQIRYGDQWLTWHKTNVAALQSEVQRLEIICGERRVMRSVRVGNY